MFLNNLKAFIKSKFKNTRKDGGTLVGSWAET
jgi:hypothetical protein